jgi:hypothetical protein
MKKTASQLFCLSKKCVRTYVIEVSDWEKPNSFSLLWFVRVVNTDCLCVNFDVCVVWLSVFVPSTHRAPFWALVLHNLANFLLFVNGGGWSFEGFNWGNFWGKVFGLRLRLCQSSIEKSWRKVFGFGCGSLWEEHKKVHWNDCKITRQTEDF